ncbi:MAG: sialate O-acetylesterase [Phycisphaerae bacterium]|nr:sialate O-acetylesterase [Tepidisphaeraceae bacterium]
MSRRRTLLASLLGLCALTGPASHAKVNDALPDPDGKPADVSKPVKVFVMMGQSNMLGMGQVAGDKDGTLEHAVKIKKRYPFLVDDKGAWTVRNDVRNVRVMVGKGGGPMGVHNNEWLTIKGSKIGPEVGIGHPVGNAVDEPVMLLKSCIGNRSLGWDLLPPGSEGYEFQDTDKKSKQVKTFVYAAYKQSPLRWEKGTQPEKIEWYAGKQYDDDVANAKKVLSELNTYYPGAKAYEVAGFFWWQGDKDRYDAGHAANYERNLVRLIEQLRKEFNAPKAKFVLATLGQTEKGAGGNDGAILNGMLAVDGDAGKYPQFKGNVATVYSHPLSKGGASNGHYGGNAETYTDIGLAMGEAMVKLLTDK